METVVYSISTPTVVTSERSVGTVIQSTTSTLNSTDSSTFVTLANESNVLVEVPVGQVIITGQAGPKGQNAEDIDMYSKRIDFVSDNLLYKGEAPVGSPESGAYWRIRKIVIGEDNDVTETWAAGTAEFNQIWANRASLTYI